MDQPVHELAKRKRDIMATRKKTTDSREVIWFYFALFLGKCESRAYLLVEKKEPIKIYVREGTPDTRSQNSLMDVDSKSTDK